MVAAATKGETKEKRKKPRELIITASFEIRIWPGRSARCNVVVFRDPCIFRGPGSSTVFFYAGHGN